MTSRWHSGVKLYVVTVLYKIFRPYRCQLELLPYSTPECYQHFLSYMSGGWPAVYIKMHQISYIDKKKSPKRITADFEYVIPDKITLPMISKFLLYHLFLCSTRFLSSTTTLWGEVCKQQIMAQSGRGALRVIRLHPKATGSTVVG